LEGGRQEIVSPLLEKGIAAVIDTKDKVGYKSPQILSVVISILLCQLELIRWEALLFTMPLKKAEEILLWCC
jgi:hypothetical protein